MYVEDGFEEWWKECGPDESVFMEGIDGCLLLTLSMDELRDYCRDAFQEGASWIIKKG